MQEIKIIVQALSKQGPSAYSNQLKDQLDAQMENSLIIYYVSK